MMNFFKINKGYVISYIIMCVASVLVFFAFEIDSKITVYYMALSLFFLCIPMIIRYFIFKSKLNSNEYVVLDKNTLSLKNKKAYEELEREIIEINSRNQSDLRDLNSYLTLWAHQVKTPLAAISLIAERSAESSVELEVQKTEEYISQMINYMKSMERSKDYSFKKTKLEGVVKKTIRKYRLFFIEKNLKLILDIKDIEIVTDPKWFGFVLDQIVFNSLKYTEDGHIKITNSEDPNVLVIEDSGIGIPKEDLPRVTGFGFTGENGREFSNSTGIGLFLVNDILHKLKYDYTIESKVGVGTRFKINLQRKGLIED